MPTTAERPFFVQRHWEKRFVVRMWDHLFERDAGFYWSPPGGYTCEQHAQRFADKLNDRFVRDQ